MSEETGKSQLERPLGRGEVFVFSEENFGGEQQRLTTTTPTAKPDFPIASIRLGPKTGITLFATDGETGLSQDLTVELASLTESRLQGQKPMSLKIWDTADRPFGGFWAIEVKGRYLSAGPDRALETSDTVSDSENFQITEIPKAPGTYAFTVRGALQEKETGSEIQQFLTIDDIQKVILSVELEAGFRKFSLMNTEDQYICYNPNEDRFFLGTNEADRAIFSKAIKIAEDESQVGELAQGEAALYENPAYWGKAWVFHEDYADFTNVVDLNDEVSSIQLGPLTGVTIYRDIQFNEGEPAAPKQDITESIPSLKEEQVQENQISSIDLWQIVPPEASGVTFTCKLSQDFKGSGDAFEECSAYRTTLRFPATVETVELWTTDEMDIEVDGQPYHVEEDQSILLKPNKIRRLVVTSPAVGGAPGKTPKGSLRAPGLKIRTDKMKPEERLVIHPDQEVHERLANLKPDEMWNANYKDAGGEEHPIIKDRGAQKQKDVANAQSMITKVMSTVKYTSNVLGGSDQTISNEALEGKNWALDFTTFRVTVRTLFVREGPDTSYEKKGYLMRNQVVKVLGFNAEGDWVHVKRVSDGLTGWSYGAYLGIIHETPTDQQYRVKALGLQVREGPGTIHRQVGLLYMDEVVTGISVNDSGTWIKIVREKDKLTGWCYAQYLTPVEPEAMKLRPAKRGLAMAAAGEPTPAPALVAPQTISGLSPIAQFHEISHEEVQALLARAEFPDAKLAQGFWDFCEDIYEGVKKAVSVVVTAVEKTWAIIVDLGNQVIGWIVDTAEKAIACVEGIIEKIGAVIEEIIKWLRFLFNWKDIVATRNFLSRSMNTMLDYIGGPLIEKASEPVTHCFEQLKQTVTQGFNRAIDQFGGCTDKTKSEPPSGNSDAFEAIDWVLSKITSAGATVFGTGRLFAYEYPASEDAELRQFWSGTLANAFGVINAPMDALSNAVNDLLKHPDEPQRVIASLLTMFRDQVIGLLDMGEDFVTGLLKLTSYLIQKIRALLNADIRIPFISDLIEWIGKLVGKDLKATLGFSLMDAATLILAIPVTLISKIRLGKAPFENVPDLALSVDGWTIASGLAGYLNAAVSIPLDMTPEGEELGKLGDVLESFSLIFSIVSLSTSWGPNIYTVENSTENPKKDREDSEADWLWWTLFGYDAFAFVLDCGSFVMEYRQQGKVERCRRSEQKAIIFSSVLGAVHLALLVWKKIKDENYIEILTDGLMTVPEICPVLRLSKNLYLSMIFGLLDVAAGTTSFVTGCLV